MKRSNGTEGKAPFTWTFHHHDLSVDPLHVTVDSLSEALAQVPWHGATWIGTKDAEGFHVW